MRAIILSLMCVAVPSSAQFEFEPKLGKKNGKVALVDMLGQVLDASGHLGELKPELEYLLFSKRVHEAALQSVVTKSGQSVELASVYFPHISHPGTDHALAVLLVKGQVVDWAACRVYDRQGRTDLMLEDVDKDGSADLSFRLKPAWGRDDPRKKKLKGDDREWLYAYRISPKGLKSIFPLTDKTRKISLVIKPAIQDVRLWVSEMPESIRENQMIRFKVHAENRSKKAIPIDEYSWFSITAQRASYGHTGPRTHPKRLLLPGETIASSVFFDMLPSQYEGEIVMEVSFSARSETSN